MMVFPECAGNPLQGQQALMTKSNPDITARNPTSNNRKGPQEGAFSWY
jgi:hypothetical protein